MLSIDECNLHAAVSFFAEIQNKCRNTLLLCHYLYRKYDLQFCLKTQNHGKQLKKRFLKKIVILPAMQHGLYQENLLARLIAIHLVFQAVVLPKSLLLAGRHSFR